MPLLGENVFLNFIVYFVIFFRRFYDNTVLFKSLRDSSIHKEIKVTDKQRMSAINEEKTGKKDIKCYETEKNTKKHGINSESEKFYTAVEYLRPNTSKWE